VVVGGVIPDDDIEPLRKLGIAEVFGQDTPPDDIVSRVRNLASARSAE
jgi:methylmalonyl-CoA mutase cobalamin-binding domain/chain